MPEKPLYGVAEDDEDRYFLLDLFRLAALVFEFGKGRFVDMRVPAGRRIAEINPAAATAFQTAHQRLMRFPAN
jgi:hypothetical protein